MTIENPISSRAVLIRLSLSQWRGGVFDKSATADVLSKAAATNKAGNFWKRLLPSCAAFKAITAMYTNLRRTHYKYTLPWDDNGGWRMISCVPNDKGESAYDLYMKEHNALAMQLETMIDDFLNNFSQYVGEAKNDLGDLHNVDDYPSEDEIRRKLRVSIACNLMPTGGDMRLDIPQEVIESYQEQLNMHLEQTKLELWQRIYDAVKVVYERARDKDARFRKEILENVQTLTDLLPSLNVTNDLELTLMRDRLVSDIGGLTSAAVRDSESVREDVIESTEQILKDTERNMESLRGILC